MLAAHPSIIAIVILSQTSNEQLAPVNVTPSISIGRVAAVAAVILLLR